MITPFSVAVQPQGLHQRGHAGSSDSKQAGFWWKMKGLAAHLT
jgi:hypothetical protein